jgi:hypothetical protein
VVLLTSVVIAVLLAGITAVIARAPAWMPRTNKVAVS